MPKVGNLNFRSGIRFDESVQRNPLTNAVTLQSIPLFWHFLRSEFRCNALDSTIKYLEHSDLVVDSTSDDIFTVAQPTPGIASTITFSPRRPPPMHSTPLSRHTSSSYLPNTSCLPQSLGQTPTLIQASSTSDHSEGIPIIFYSPSFS